MTTRWLYLFALIIYVCKPTCNDCNYVKIGDGMSCIGASGALNEIGQSDKQIVYDLTPMYDGNGHIPDNNNNYIMSLCGPLTEEAKACNTSDNWCFVERNQDDESCKKGIANWEESTETGSMIYYEAMCMYLNKYILIYNCRKIAINHRYLSIYKHMQYVYS